MQLESDLKQLSTWEWMKRKVATIFKPRPPAEDADVFAYEFDTAAIDESSVITEIVGAVFKAIIVSLICAMAIQISFAVYSAGGLVHLLAQSMASLCLSGGSCHVPTLLTSITLGLILTVAVAMILLSPIRLLFGPSKWRNLHDHVDLVDEKLDALHKQIAALETVILEMGAPAEAAEHAD